MNIVEYIEEDEEPPLQLSSCPSHGNCMQKKKKVWCKLHELGRVHPILLKPSADPWACVCVCLAGVWLWGDCSSAVSVGGRMRVSAMPCWPGAFHGETTNWNIQNRSVLFWICCIQLVSSKESKSVEWMRNVSTAKSWKYALLFRSIFPPPTY